MNKTRLIVFSFLLVFLSSCAVYQSLTQKESAKYNSSEAYFEEARRLYNLKEYRDALEVYESFLTDIPQEDLSESDKAWLIYETGLTYLRLKNYNKAQEHFEQVLRTSDVLAAVTLSEQRLEEIRRERPEAL